METIVERVARAIDDAEVGYSIYLDRLVDGVSTYALKYNDDTGLLEFPSFEDASEHRRNRLQLARARAAIEAMREPTEGMVDAAYEAASMDDRWCIEDDADYRRAHQAALDAALAEPQS